MEADQITTIRDHFDMRMFCIRALAFFYSYHEIFFDFHIAHESFLDVIVYKHFFVIAPWVIANGIVVLSILWFCCEKMSMKCVMFCNLSENQSRHRSRRIGTNQIYIQYHILIRMFWFCVHAFF